MNDWLRGIRNLVKTKDWWKILAAKLRGHIQYYGVSENYASVAKFYKLTLRMVRKRLNRRSQKRKMNVAGFREYLEHYPLPKPRIVHKFYDCHV
jgi:RNA-directed DNA polymerase